MENQTSTNPSELVVVNLSWTPSETAEKKASEILAEFTGPDNMISADKVNAFVDQIINAPSVDSLDLILLSIQALQKADKSVLKKLFCKPYETTGGRGIFVKWLNFSMERMQKRRRESQIDEQATDQQKVVRLEEAVACEIIKFISAFQVVKTVKQLNILKEKIGVDWIGIVERFERYAKENKIFLLISATYYSRRFLENITKKAEKPSNDTQVSMKPVDAPVVASVTPAPAPSTGSVVPGADDKNKPLSSSDSSVTDHKAKLSSTEPYSETQKKAHDNKPGNDSRVPYGQDQPTSNTGFANVPNARNSDNSGWGSEIPKKDYHSSTSQTSNKPYRFNEDGEIRESLSRKGTQPEPGSEKRYNHLSGYNAETSEPKHFSHSSVYEKSQGDRDRSISRAASNEYNYNKNSDSRKRDRVDDYHREERNYDYNHGDSRNARGSYDYSSKSGQRDRDYNNRSERNFSYDHHDSRRGKGSSDYSSRSNHDDSYVNDIKRNGSYDYDGRKPSSHGNNNRDYRSGGNSKSSHSNSYDDDYGQRDSAKYNSRNENDASSGNGRGRGRDLTKPAWMTRDSDTPNSYPEDKTSSRSRRTEPSHNTVVAVGRGKGRGRGNTLPAWMTKGNVSEEVIQKQVSNAEEIRRNEPPEELKRPPPIDEGFMGGKKKKKKKGSQQKQQQPKAPAQSQTFTGGQGRGRGRDLTKPAWMTRNSDSLDSNNTAQASLTSSSTAPTNNSTSVRVEPSHNTVGAVDRRRGRGRGNTLPAWMTKGNVSEEVIQKQVSNAEEIRRNEPPEQLKRPPPIDEGFMGGKKKKKKKGSQQKQQQPKAPVQSQTFTGGQGRGRGRDLTKPAWMTRSS